MSILTEEFVALLDFSISAGRLVNPSMESSDTASHEFVRVPTEINSELFVDVLKTALPFGISKRSMKNQWSCLLLDEERLIGADDEVCWFIL